MRKGLAVLATIAALAAGPPAAATQFLYTVTGTVIGEELSFDEFDVFDPHQGDAFTASFLVDDAATAALYDYDVTGSSAKGGGSVQLGTRTPLTLTLTIGGATYAIRTGDYHLYPVIDPETDDPIGPTDLIDEGGSIEKNAASHRLSLDSQFGQSHSCSFPHPGDSFGEHEELEFTLYSAAFTDADYRQTGAFALAPASFGGFYRYEASGPYPGNMAQISLLATSLTVVPLGAVPEITSWLMMILGVGIAGWAARERRPDAAYPRMTR